MRGTRRFGVDPRRRFGRHGGARRLLSVDGDVPAENGGAWGGLVSALQRHTVHGELAQLAREDRQILSLAYLSGHTNREIAAMLQVSVSTVRRRLSVALARLDESMRKAGLWISALLLGALGLYERISHTARTLRPSTVAVVAAGTITAVTLGAASLGPAGTQNAQASSQAHTAQPVLVLPLLGGSLPAISTQTQTTVADVTTASSKGKPAHAGQDEVGPAQIYGCHGNPTDAPPLTPVRSHGNGSPVNPPRKGGCGPHAS